MLTALLYIYNCVPLVPLFKEIIYNYFEGLCDSIYVISLSIFMYLGR